MPTVKFKPEVLSTINSIMTSKAMGLNEYAICFDNKILTLKMRSVDNTAAIELISDGPLDVDTDDSFEMKMSSKDIASVLKLAKKDEICIFMGEGFFTANIGNFKKKFPMFDTDVRTMEKYPSPQLTQSFTLNDEQVDDVIKVLSEAKENDRVYITVDESFISFAWKNDQSETSVFYPRDDIKDFNIGKDFTSQFDALYFKGIISNKPKDIDLAIMLDKEFPIDFRFALPIGTAKMMLAPIIEYD